MFPDGRLIGLDTNVCLLFSVNKPLTNTQLSSHYGFTQPPRENGASLARTHKADLGSFCVLGVLPWTYSRGSQSVKEEPGQKEIWIFCLSRLQTLSDDFYMWIWLRRLFVFLNWALYLKKKRSFLVFLWNLSTNDNKV